MTNVDGIWTGRNLPHAALQLLVTRNVAPATIATAAYDAFAETIPWPRPAGTVALKAVE